MFGSEKITALETRMQQIEQHYKRADSTYKYNECIGEVARLTRICQTIQDQDRTGDVLAPHIASLGLLLKGVQEAVQKAEAQQAAFDISAVDRLVSALDRYATAPRFLEKIATKAVKAHKKRAVAKRKIKVRRIKAKRK